MSSKRKSKQAIAIKRLAQKRRYEAKKAFIKSLRFKSFDDLKPCVKKETFFADNSEEIIAEFQQQKEEARAVLFKKF
jgi:hypothetical protein